MKVVLPWVLLILCLISGAWQNQEKQNLMQTLRLTQEQLRIVKSRFSTNQKDVYIAKAVNNSITKASTQLQACYLTYLDSLPDVKEGKVKLDWQIDTKGQVFAAGVVSSSFQDQTIEHCLIQKLSAIQFPAPPLGMTKYVEHSLFFKNQAS